MLRVSKYFLVVFISFTCLTSKIVAADDVNAPPPYDEQPQIFMHQEQMQQLQQRIQQLEQRAVEMRGAYRKKMLLTLAGVGIVGVGVGIVLGKNVWDLSTSFRELEVLKKEVTDTRGELGVLKGNFSDVWGNFTDTRGESGVPKGNFSDVWGNFADIRGELGALKGNFSDVWGNFADIRGELGALKGNFSDIWRNFTDARGELGALKEQIKGCAKAWVTFDVSGTSARILDSYGVSSVIRNGLAEYTISFSQPFNSINYGSALSVKSDGYVIVVANHHAYSQTRDNFKLVTYLSTGGYRDPLFVSAYFYGN